MREARPVGGTPPEPSVRSRWSPASTASARARSAGASDPQLGPCARQLTAVRRWAATSLRIPWSAAALWPKSSAHSATRFGARLDGSRPLRSSRSGPLPGGGWDSGVPPGTGLPQDAGGGDRGARPDPATAGEPGGGEPRETRPLGSLGPQEVAGVAAGVLLQVVLVVLLGRVPRRGLGDLGDDGPLPLAGGLDALLGLLGGRLLGVVG